MASEDSDQFVSGFLPVRRLRDLRDLDETADRLVSTGRHEFDAAGELLEVLLLRTQHRMLSEERDDRLQKITATTHDVAQHVLSMVVVPLVRDHTAHAEELTQLFEARDAGSALRDRELVSYLETGRVAAPARTVWLPYEAD